MKLVITGDADCGKTVIAHILACQFRDKVKVIPNVSNLLEDFMIPAPKTIDGQKAWVRAQYLLQKEIEEILRAENEPDCLLVCDRGSIDFLSVWPDSPFSFFKENKTSLKAELQRYDQVIELSVSSKTDPEATCLMDQVAHYHWKQHPHFTRINMDNGIFIDAKAVIQIARKMLSQAPENQSLQPSL